MRKLIFIVGLCLSSLSSKAMDYFEDINYCTWMGSAANVIVKNLDLGINEYDLIGRYLKHGDSYDEQIIIISLIDRIYSSQKHNDFDMVTLQAESACMSAMLNN